MAIRFYQTDPDDPLKRPLWASFDQDATPEEILTRFAESVRRERKIAEQNRRLEERDGD